ncbi:hypothetical protein EAG_04186 [Camponotus floridanus]|uniref:Uncharacterized protein n=1 Tax=Camponotus floridanus TaxID=104421 RepID=E1ZZV1_CAMFO|nr:hypothetical protein EAG_04186 [Camponotus floridanus]
MTSKPNVSSRKTYTFLLCVPLPEKFDEMPRERFGECQWNEIPKSTSRTLRRGIQGSQSLPYVVPAHKFRARAPAGADQRDSGYQKPGVPVVSAAAPASGPRADTKAPCDASWSGVLNHDRRCKSIEDPACDSTSRSTGRSEKRRRRTDDCFEKLSR